MVPTGTPGGRARGRPPLKADEGLRLLIMDEPTAGLDARAEERLFQQYAGMGRPRGGVTVLVTHRLTTAQAAARRGVSQGLTARPP